MSPRYGNAKAFRGSSGYFSAETRQIRLCGGEVSRQIGGFRRAEQRGRGVSAFGLAAGVCLELPAGFIELAQLPQRLAEEEHALVCPSLVGIRCQERPELLDGEFPFLMLVVTRRNGELIVGFAGPRALVGSKHGPGDQRDRQYSTNRSQHGKSVWGFAKKGKQSERNKPQWPRGHRGLLRPLFATTEGG